MFEIDKGSFLQMQRFRFDCTLLMFLMAVLICQSAYAEKFYKFKDNKGRTLIQDSIPPEYAKKGYKIVNAQGMTLEVVLSEAEQRRKLKESQRHLHEKTLAEQEKEAQKERDARLFQSFSSAEDIRQAGNKKIMVVQKQIETTFKHIQAFEKNLAELEAQQAAGGKSNEEAIRKLRDSIRKNNLFILRKREEQNRIRDEYVGYIKRYQMLSIVHK